MDGNIPLVDPDVLRLAMRQWVTGVTVVTSAHQCVRHGMTVSSFTSVSLNPPLVLISLALGARTKELVEQSGIFGITILGEHQQEVSDRFAGRQTEYSDRFQNLDTFTLTTQAPFLTDGLAFLDCRVISSFKAGNNTLYIGEVLTAQVGKSGQPLIYYNRDYWDLCP